MHNQINKQTVSGVKRLAGVKPFPRDEGATTVPAPHAATAPSRDQLGRGDVHTLAEGVMGCLPPSPGCFHNQQLPEDGPKCKQESSGGEHLNSDKMPNPGHSYPLSAAAQGGEQTLLSTALLPALVLTICRLKCCQQIQTEM